MPRPTCHPELVPDFSLFGDARLDAGTPGSVR
jgi:hypothetical protein